MRCVRLIELSSFQGFNKYFLTMLVFVSLTVLHVAVVK